MSYFNEIYNDPELNARAKQVLVYLHDRANKDGESWYAINTMAKDLSLSRSTIKRALAELTRPWRVSSARAGWRNRQDSGRPGDVLPIVIEYSKVALIASYP